MFIVAALWVHFFRPHVQHHAGYILTSSNKLQRITKNQLKWEYPSLVGNPYEIALGCKLWLNQLSHQAFDRVKMRGVPHEDNILDKASKGYYKLQDLDRMMGLVWAEKRVVDLFAGRGGWSEYAHERGADVVAYSWWTKMYEQWKGPDAVRTIDGDIRKAVPSWCNLLLADCGEAYKDFKQENAVNYDLLKTVDRWMQLKPHQFIIRIQTPHDPRVVRLLESWQEVTGKGTLVRLRRDRLSSTNMYFISEKVEDLRPLIVGFYHELTRRRLAAEEDQVTPMKYAHNVPVWEAEAEMPGVPRLDPLDMSKSIEEMHMTEEPINITKFFKEISYRKAKPWGSVGGRQNGFIRQAIGSLYELLAASHSLAVWDMTSTVPKAVYDIFKRKVDKAPVEQHPHWEGLRRVYSELAGYVGRTLAPLSDEEILANINRKGAMGYQMANLGYPNLGSYVDQGPWRSDVQSYADALRAGRPKWSVFNSVAKKEKKKNYSREKKGSRLIQYLPAPARLFEMKILGGLHHVLERLPWTVAGVPLYDYGDRIAEKLKKCPDVVSEDVAGWDTTISKGLQRLECMFLMSISKTDQLAHDIEAMYSVYANPHVVVQRDWYGETHDVLMRGRGQVSSGRQPTYACNTITNFCVTMYTALRALGVTENHWGRAIRKICDGEGNLDMMISGDDKLVFFARPENSKDYAEKAYHITNEMGMLRKDVPVDAPSVILNNIEDIWFCSHTYEEVTYKNGKTKNMPVRDVGEIVAKALYSTGSFADTGTAEAWARIQGFNLLVNYHHIPEIRYLALAILSGTRVGLNLLGVSIGWNMSREWLTDLLAVETVSRLLFGDHSLTGYRDLGYIDYKSRFKGLNIRPTNRAYKKWKMEIPDNIEKMRGLAGPGHFKDWMSNVTMP